MATLNREIGSAQRIRGAAAALAGGWLLFRRAMAFASYGLVAAGLGWVVHPLLAREARWRGRTRDETELRAQRMVHWGTRGHLRFVEAIGVARITGVGTERLEKRPQLIVANHPSLWDTPVLTRFLPEADFIVSAGWSENPLMRGAVRAAGYLHAERGALALRDAVKRLRGGRSVVVYPEGSRSLPEGLRPFQSGAAHIALLADFDIVPVVIRVLPRTLMPGQGYADMPDVRPEWKVEVGEPIHPPDYLHPGETSVQGARRVTAVLQDFFEKRWERGNC